LFVKGATVAREVELAERDPAGYVRRFAKRLGDRDISKPVRQLPWIALVDGLIAARSGAEIDHRELVAKWLAELRRVVPEAVRRALPSRKELEALSPATNDVLLDVVSDRLAEKGWVLVEIDLKHDAYPVAPVRARDAQALVKAARAAGGRVLVKGGADLAKLARAHEREVGAAQRRKQRRAREQSAGGAAWQKLVAKRSFTLAVAKLPSATPAEERLFVQAAAEAPTPFREKAQAIAAVLVDPVEAARRYEPLVLLRLLEHPRQTPRSVAARVRALGVIAKRIRLGSDARATQMFFRACRFFTRPELLQAARSAAPADAKRWKRIAEQRHLARPHWNTKVALMWLGPAAEAPARGR